MIKITVNDKEIDVEKDSTVFQACEKIGVELPHFCYHSKLEIAGNCRACLVEIDKIPKPVASCAYPVNEGMVIKTESEMVKKARHGVLELLLINHPLDCPVCDQGGECDLQDITVAYGKGNSRFDLNKRLVSNKNMGPLISTHMTRCIHCTRCVRFMKDIAGSPEIGSFGRGERTEISTYLEKSITSELSGNIIDICPVGALNNKPYAYQGRSWELEKTKSIDILDAVGSNIRIDVRGQNIMRILPDQNDDINECWISDQTRFSYDGIHNQRIDSPYIKKNGKLIKATWGEAFSYIAKNLSNIKPLEVAALAGELVDVESAFLLKEFMRKINSPHTDCRPINSQIISDNRSAYTFNTTIRGIEDADCILLIATNPRLEAPLINARIRKRYMMDDVSIGSIGNNDDLSYPYDHLGNDANILKEILNKNHPFSQKWFSAKKPMLIIGQSALNRRDSLTIQEIAQKLCLDANAFHEDWNGYNVLHLYGGQVGALDIEFTPGPNGYNTEKIIEQCQSGSLKAIYLLGVDSIHPQSLKNAFIIYQGHHGDIGAQGADVVLPGLTYTEKKALYVNTEGRVQQSQKAVKAPGDAKEDWKIIRALSQVLNITLPYDSQEQIHQKLATLYPAFANINAVVKNPLKKIIKPTYESLSHKEFAPIFMTGYMTNIISRHSMIMADCIKAQREGKKNA